MPLEEWVDLPKIKMLCHHTSTFVLGVLVSALGKPFLALAAYIGVLCHEPFAPWLLHGLAQADDILIAYFALALLWKFAKELWPFGSHHMFMIVGFYESALPKG